MQETSMCHANNGAMLLERHTCHEQSRRLRFRAAIVEPQGILFRLLNACPTEYGKPGILKIDRPKGAAAPQSSPSPFTLVAVIPLAALLLHAGLLLYLPRCRLLQIQVDYARSTPTFPFCRVPPYRYDEVAAIMDARSDLISTDSAFRIRNAGAFSTSSLLLPPIFPMAVRRQASTPQLMCSQKGGEGLLARLYPHC